MATLPIEQVLQKQHFNIVSAPGVTLWGSSTDDWDMATWTADVDVIDEVEAGEVELAQMAQPEFFWEVISPSVPYGPVSVYGEDDYSEGVYGSEYLEANEGPFGIFQNTEFSDWNFGDGPFGGPELEWYDERPQYQYSMTGGE